MQIRSARYLALDTPPATYLFLNCLCGGQSHGSDAVMAGCSTRSPDAVPTLARFDIRPHSDCTGLAAQLPRYLGTWVVIRHHMAVKYGN